MRGRANGNRQATASVDDAALPPHESVRAACLPVKRLYLFLLGTVLCVAGCAQDRSNPPSDDSSRSATAPSATAPDSAQAPLPARQSVRTPSDPDSDPDTSSPLRVLVLGNSIAAGYGLPRPSEQSFPGRLQQRVDSLGWEVRVQNAGLSGETTAGGLRRIGWLLQQPVDVLVLELGGNDGLRGVDLSATRENLTAIVDTTLSRSPEAQILLAGMQIPPNLGPEYTERFRNLYPAIADDYDRVTLIPFILQGVGDTERFMQNDGIHPNAAGQRRVAKTVWQYLRPVLEQMRAEPA